MEWTSKKTVVEKNNEAYQKMLQDGETTVQQHIQDVVDAYNTAYKLSFKDVYRCKDYKDDQGYTHQQFCIDVWAWNVEVWEHLRNVILPAVEEGAVYTEAELIAELPAYTGVK